MAAPVPFVPPHTETSAVESAPGESRRTIVYLALLVCAVIVVLAGIVALPLTDPDEVFYAQTAGEMLAHKSFLTPLLFGQPQFEKPPLTYWLLMASFKMFGLHPWTARLVPALAGLLGALATFLFARRIVRRETAALAALIQASSLACLGQSMALLTDMVFTTFVAIAFFFLYTWFGERRARHLQLFGVFAALAVLTKGPVALVILLLGATLFLALARDTHALGRFLVNPWWLTFAAIAAPWYVWAWVSYGHAFAWEFLVHDNWHRILRAEHTNFDTWAFYPAVIVVGMFPWTPLFAYLGAGYRKHRTAMAFLLSWIVVTYAIFGVAHSKLASYVLPLFPALALLLAIALATPGESPRRARIAATLSLLFGAVFLVVPLVVKPAMIAQFRLTILAASAFGALQVVAAILLLLRRRTPAIALTTAGFLALVLVTLTTLPASATAGFTEADLPPLIARYGLQGQTVVASKLHARGVVFHTGNPVVVMDRNEHPFWSDHPLPVLWRDEQLREFFDAREKVLCTIRPGDLERLNRLFARTRANTVLSDAFDRIVVLSAKK